MELIKSIFKKEDDISSEDLNAELLNKHREEYWLECKSFAYVNSDEENHILRPLIGFLNSEFGKGLLIFGADESNNLITGFSGIPDSKYDVKRIEDLIKENLVSIPKLKNSYLLLIRSVKISQSNTVYLLEIENTNDNCVYVSKKSYLCYVRRLSSSEKITPQEMMELIEKRSYAKVYIEIGAKTGWIRKDDGKLFINDEKGKYPLNIVFSNTGLVPAKNIRSIMNFTLNGDIKIKLSKEALLLKNEPPLPNMLRFSASSDFGQVQEVIYPGMPVDIGKLIVSESPGIKFVLDIRTFSDRGYTNQKFLFQFTTSQPKVFLMKEILIMEEDQSKREYVSYISKT